MALDLKFAFVCQKQFAELEWENDVRRYCNECRLVVTNLDALDDEARLELFEAAAKSSERLCVSVTVPVENAVSCSSRPALGGGSISLGGYILPPPGLAEERERLERLRRRNPLSRLLSKFNLWK